MPLWSHLKILKNVFGDTEIVVLQTFTYSLGTAACNFFQNTFWDP